MPLAPFESSADDRLHQHVVRPASYAHADSKVDLPLRRNIQIERGHELLRLARERIEFSNRPQTTVVFKAEGHDLGEVPGDLRVRSELPPASSLGPGVGFLECRIDGPVQTPLLFVYDGPYLQAPDRTGEDRASISEFRRQTDANRPMPAFRCTHSRPDVIAHPPPSLVIWHRSEDVEPGLEPGRDALRDLDCLMQFVLGGQDSVHGRLRPDRKSTRL